MSHRSLDVHQVAAELGRSGDWLYGNWRDLVKARKLPPPVVEKGGLAWNAAQVYAVLDKPLTRDQRIAAAAFRAALAAAEREPEVAAGRRRLEERFAAVGSRE